MIKNLEGILTSFYISAEQVELDLEWAEIISEPATTVESLTNAAKVWAPSQKALLDLSVSIPAGCLKHYKKYWSEITSDKIIRSWIK